MKSYIETIKEIQDELKWDPDLFETEIHIELNDAIATLSGEVDSQKKKNAAESITRKAEGIKDVINKLVVTHHDEHVNKKEPLQVPSPNSGEPDNSLKISGA